MLEWKQDTDLWLADNAGWLLTVGPQPMPNAGWLYSVEREDGNLPNILGECSNPEQGRRLAEAAFVRLAAMPVE